MHYNPAAQQYQAGYSQPQNTKYDIYESGRRIGTVHNVGLADQIVAEIARRDAKAAAEWAVSGVAK